MKVLRKTYRFCDEDHDYINAIQRLVHTRNRCGKVFGKDIVSSWRFHLTSIVFTLYEARAGVRAIVLLRVASGHGKLKYRERHLRNAIIYTK